MRTSIAALALVLGVAACGGGKDRGTDPKPAAVASVVLSQQSATLFVGSSLTLTATARDAAGNALSGRPVSWTTSSAGSATVLDGVVLAIAPGLATITATVEGKTADAAITVRVVPVAQVTVAPATVGLEIGATRQLAATLTDQFGRPVAGRTIVWTSSDDAKVTVTRDGGLVKALAAGTVTITATSEEKSGTASITVASENAPKLSAVSPDTMLPSATITITGRNFAATKEGNTVTVDGQAATVLDASETQLTAVLPASFPCQPTRPVAVVVSTAEGPGSREQVLRVATPRALGAGGAMLISEPAAIACNELAATGGRYLVSVYSVSTLPFSRAAFELRGAAGPAVAGGPLPATIAPLVRQRQWPAVAQVKPWSPFRSADARRKAASDHLAALESWRTLARRWGKLSRRGDATLQRSAARAPVPLTVGAIATLRMRNALNDCQHYTNLGARVVYVGTKSVVLEDTLAPFARTVDTDYQYFGRTFDEVMYPILTANFGDPLVADSETDGNGRVLMLFTPSVNAMGGIAGFVSPCDLYPPDANIGRAASNQAEIFYAPVPDSKDWPAAGWRGYMPGTIIHESKHIAALAGRLTSPDFVTLEESWLEEGLAQLAIELYARRGYGTSWKSNATYRETVYCDVRRNSSGACAGAEFLMADVFAWLEDYFAAHESRSYLAPGGLDPTIYGSGWLFARWATDHYAASEPAFLKSLVLDATRSGIVNVSDKTGQPFAELAGWFALAQIADDYPGLVATDGALQTEPSWNLPDVFTGFGTDFPQYFPLAPVTKHEVEFGSFAVSVPWLAGGSAAFFEIGGAQSGSQLLDLHATNGTPLPAGTTLRVGIVRVQ